MTLLNRLREVAVDRRNNRSDHILFGTMLALSGFGLLMIYSATRSAGYAGMERQMIFVAAGLTIYVIVSNIDYREYRGIIPWLSLAVLIGLGAVFLFDPVNGAQRWIPLGFFKLQPAEFAKVAVILLLAFILSPHTRDEIGRRNLSWGHIFQALGGGGNSRRPRISRARPGHRSRLPVHPVRHALRGRSHLATIGRTTHGNGSGHRGRSGSRAGWTNIS